MPVNMRLHTRSECPVEDTPPSTRPSSAASSAPSTSGTPHRSTSMDSLNTSSSTGEKPSGEEIIPTRMTKTTPKVNANAMQFVKTGPASLHRSAKEQMKKAQVVKSLRKTSLQEEEEEWQSKRTANFEEGSDWQANLDKWKSSRRKKNEDVLERVIEVKKYEEEETRTRRKSKTFSEMREQTGKKGRRYNLVVHDDDNNDLADLGLGGSKGSEELKDDSKDAKSDAGFCTGSDTGSDGVFPEDNISDTSSALGDKKENPDCLLDSLSTPKCNVPEYTYDKAIEDYKQFAENSAKKRTPISPNHYSSNKNLEQQSSPSNTIEDKLAFLSEQQLPKVVRRHKLPKIDLDKRRSMFELRSIDNEVPKSNSTNRRSIEVGSELKNKVLSFENINSFKNDDRKRAVTLPPPDSKFKEKLASFSHETIDSSPVRKKTPERDQNFYKKLQSFTRLESSSSVSQVDRSVSEVSNTWESKSYSNVKSNVDCLKVENSSTTKSVSETLKSSIGVIEERNLIESRVSSEEKKSVILKERIESFEAKELSTDSLKWGPDNESLETLIDDSVIPAQNISEEKMNQELQDDFVTKFPINKYEEKTSSNSSLNDHLQRNSIDFSSDSSPDAPPSPPKCPPPIMDVEKEIEAIEACVLKALSNEQHDSEIDPCPVQQEHMFPYIEPINYEPLSEAATGMPTYSEENLYERINEPVYENIYEKVHEEEHHYQTLQEVSPLKEELPALPPKNPPAIEVFDINWTDSSHALPPSVPPPPPPQEDEDEPPLLQDISTVTKDVLRQKMSDFLGSQPPKGEVVTMLPPPNVNQILRQEREDERQIIQKQHNLARSPPMLDALLPQPYRPRYTWEDRMKADHSKPQDLDESNDHLEFQSKLCELELEMEKHDRSMMHRIKEPAPTLPPKQNLYSSNIPPPAQYCERPIQNESDIRLNSHQDTVESKESPFPIQEFYRAPVYTPQQNNKENIYSNDSVINAVNGFESESLKPMTQTKENDVWIMRRKADAPKKDYNRHWLIQEAEQRRLEQQDRITRPPHADSTKFSSLTSRTHFQNIKSSFSPSTETPPPLPPQVFTPANNCSPTHEANSQPRWKQQPKTYQPSPPPPQSNNKPLPDAIINTLTQRVKNKVNLSNGIEESYHDYMNTGPQENTDEQRLLSVSGKKKCSHCSEELGRGAAMIIESLRLFYHIPCFKCCVCGIQLGNGTSGADVRVRNHKLHCHNCYSNDEGMKFSKV